MLNISFDTLNQLENVKSAGSDLQLNPLHDESLTIFLNNGYRLISTKSIFGQTITLEPFEDSVKSMPSYQSEVYHEVDMLRDKPEDKFFEIISSEKKEITSGVFSEKLRDITGDAVYQFLIERHAFLPHRTIFNNKSTI